MNYFITSIAGIISGALAAMGLGGGGVLIIYLTIFASVEQSVAQGINLIFFIPIAIIAICIYLKKKLISIKFAIICSVFGIVGAVIGSMIINYVSNDILRKIFGGLLFIIGLIQLFGKDKN